MNIRFLTPAQQEVDDAVFWYNNQTENAGLEFLDELDRAVRLVRSYPHALTEIEPEIRRCLLARFPYALIYGVEQHTIVIVAVAHVHRQPGYWSDRLPDERRR
jgi:plasmid stabilization system protein ParE